MSESPSDDDGIEGVFHDIQKMLREGMLSSYSNGYLDGLGMARGAISVLTEADSHLPSTMISVLEEISGALSRAADEVMAAYMKGMASND